MRGAKPTSCESCGETFPSRRAMYRHRKSCPLRKSRHATPEGLVRLRSDLRRVARLCGRPEGAAPSFVEYLAHGIVHPTTVQAALGGRVPGSCRPRITWRQAMEKLCLTPADDLYRASKRQRVAGDVYRVATELGDPMRMPSRREYARLGRWDETTVRNHIGRTRTWTAAAYELGLRPNRPFPRSQQET